MKMEVEGTLVRGTNRGTPQRRTRPDLQRRNGLRFKSLLVPIDFSETSLKALDYALSLAREFGSQLRLIHVLEPPAVFDSDYTAYTAWDKAAAERARLRLEELIQERIDETFPVTREVRLGRAYKSICAAAKLQGSDLIVVGTHGAGLRRLFLGSTAEKVIRYAPCSVLAVRSQKHRNGKSALKPGKIMVPTDFSDPAKKALHSAVDLARKYNARIQLVNVVQVHYAVGDIDQMDFRMLETQMRDTGEKRLASLSKALAAKKVPAITKLLYGRPATEITEAAKELGTDLIMISTHGRTGLKRALVGSITEEVVRHAPCPVLVVRQQ